MMNLQVVDIVGFGCHSRHGLGWRPIGLSVIKTLGGHRLHTEGI